MLNACQSRVPKKLTTQQQQKQKRAHYKCRRRRGAQKQQVSSVFGARFDHFVTAAGAVSLTGQANGTQSKKKFKPEAQTTVSEIMLYLLSFIERA